MKHMKIKIGLILSLIGLIGIVSVRNNSPKSIKSANIECSNFCITPELASMGNPPEATGLLSKYTLNNGVPLPYDSYPMPWESYDHGMFPFMLLWEVEFNNDTLITNYFWNITYGSLDGNNGTFSQIGENSTHTGSEPNHTISGENVNPLFLMDFGYIISVYLEDEDGESSQAYKKLCKYRNVGGGAVPESPELTVSTPDEVINVWGDLEVTFVIEDPDEGEVNYTVDVTCDQDISHIEQTVTNFSAIFNENNEDVWTPGLTYNFTFTLKKWEEATIVSTSVDYLAVYINQPPENGTCTISPPSGIENDTEFLVNCTGWVDDRSDVLEYGIYMFTVSGTDIIFLEPLEASHLILFKLYKGDFDLFVRIKDLDGGFTDFALPTVRVNDDGGDSIGGAPSDVLIWGSLGMIAVIALRINKLKPMKN